MKQDASSAKTDPQQVVAVPLKQKNQPKPGKPITSPSNALTGKSQKKKPQNPQTGIIVDAQTGVLGTGNGQVTIVVHSNVKGVVAQIKEKFATYQETLHPSLKLTCTPVVSMKNLGTNSKSKIVTPSKIIKTSKAEDLEKTPKLTMTSSVPGRKGVDTKR